MNSPTIAPNNPVSRPPCPSCQGRLRRVRRTLFDRLRAYFLPRAQVLYRYRCCASSCAWTGSLEHSVYGRNAYSDAPAGRYVLDPARMSGFGD